MPETERDRVNACISAAHDKVQAMPEGQVRLLAGVAVECVEAVCRSVRDADDDLWKIEESITKGIADLITVVNGIDFSPRKR